MKVKAIQKERVLRAALFILLMSLPGMMKMYAQNISFADASVKAICVANWDTDGDGELNQNEAITVTSLDGMFMFDDGITSFDELLFFTGVTSIGEDEFNSCTNLTSITIPNGVTSIGNAAFSDCSSLTLITSYAFTPPILGNNVFDNVSSTVVVKVPCYTSALYQATNGWNDISNYEEFMFDLCPIIFVDDNVKAICVAHWDTNDDGELSYAEAAAVTNLGTYFKSTAITSFDELEYFTSLSSLPNTAFYGCTNLTSITLPSSVSALGNGSFYNCTSLATMTVNAETPPTVGTNAFKNVPTNMVVQVPCGAFGAYHDANDWGAFSLFDPCLIVFADANVKALCVANWDTNGDGELSYAEAAVVTDLGQVFKNNTTITSFDELQYFTGLVSIGDYAFYYCTGLTSIEIPNSVTSISSYAFCSCSSLTSIELSNSVTSVGYAAFSSCSGLTSIAIPNSVTSIGGYAFSSCSGLTSIAIPNSVTSIGSYAFYYCTKLTSIEIPNFVTSIGNNTFYSCSSLTSIIIPNSVTSIGSYAFYGCSHLTSMTVLADNPPTFGNYAFYNVPKGIPVYLLCGSVEAYSAANWGGFSNFIGFCGGTITVAANPEEGGTVTGNGVFGAGESCTVMAIENEGYAFSAWTLDGTIVSTNAEYTFYVQADWDLVAHFMPDANIAFADANVKALCVANWDADGDGELSYAEAGAVADLGQVFKNKTTITSFNELQYFTGLTSIGSNAFSSCSNLASIDIPNAVTSIESYAFYGCSGLTSIEIPNSVTSIGNYAFYNCTGLTLIEIPNSVTSIGSYTFSGCSGLTSFEIPNSVSLIKSTALSNCSGLEQIIVDSENIVYDSRENCNAIIETSTNKLVVGCKTTIIPNSVTSIGSSAFRGCSGLTSIEIPNSVTSIGSYAFYNCSGLTSIEISNNVTSIGSFTFYDCRRLTSIIIPNSVTSIGNSTFRGCSGLTSIGIPNSVTSIESYAFYDCTHLTSIEIPDSLISISSYVFYDCRGLTSIEIPNSVTSISFNAFENCSGLTSIEIPNSVTYIGNYAFRGCNGLTSLTIGNSVTYIGNYAFAACSYLTSMIVLANNPTSLGNAAFSSMIKNIPVYVPCESVEAYTTANWGGFNNIIGLCGGTVTVAANPEEGGTVTGGGVYGAGETCTVTATPNEGYAFTFWTRNGNRVSTDAEYTFYVPGDIDLVANFMSDANITFANADVKSICVNHWDANGDGELSYAEAAVVTSLGEVFSNYFSYSYYPSFSFNELQFFIGLTSIDNYAFRDCSGLTSIIIPNSVTSIGSSAFLYCSSLTSIEIPNSVTSIGNGAFYGCSGLEQMIVDSGNTIYDSRENCNAIIETSTNKLVAGCKNTSIPNSVISIGSSAFSGCRGLISIEIPNSVTSIGNSAFYGCSGLASIELPNSVTSIGSGAFGYCIGLRLLAVLAETPPALDNNYVFSDVNMGILIYVPCGSVEAYTAANWGGFSNFIGFCGGTVSVTANPEEGGTVTGGGTFGADETCTVTATENEGYAFAFWTQNGIKASINAEYTFYVSGDMDLEAHFLSEASITFADTLVKSICVNHWDTNGDGELSYVEAAAVTDLGQVFSNDFMYGSMYDCMITSFDELQYFTGLTSINNSAFSYCTNLTSVVIPNSVISIGSDAFHDCSSLTSIEIPNSVTSIGGWAFSYCSSLTSIEIPNSVTSIGSSAFSDCSSLTSIEIPNSVTSIGSSAFSGCSGLEQMIVDSGNTVYDSRENCNAIIETSTNVLVAGCKNSVIPSSVTSIGYGAFSYCSGLTSIEIPNSVTSIGHNAFSYCIGLVSIEIPNSVTSIGDWAFSSCSGLVLIEISNSVTSIGSDAFYDCTGLASMTVLADNPPTLGYNAFSDVNLGIPVYVPCGSVDTYTAANWGGFNNIIGFCGGTVNVAANPAEGGTVTGDGTFGADETCTVTATQNEGYAFALWTRDGINVSTNPEYTFYVSGEMNLVAHFVPDANIVFADANVKSICVDHWDTDGDGELSYAEAALVTNLREVFRYNSIITSFDELQYFIGLTSISANAFNSCSGLISIVLPNSLTSIGYNAFSHCISLVSIEIPNSVTSIGDWAFSSCSGLVLIEISNSVTSIGSDAFYDCTGLASMTVLADNPPTLGYNAFSDVNLGIPVYVPCGSVDTYTAANWGGFNNIIGFCGGTVTVSANLEEGGSVTGGGMFGADETCTVTATENEGYAFTLWTRNGIKVSTNPEYTFYVSGEMNLVAHFVPEANIDFADANVKSICVDHWDTNGDGELSYVEAAAVLSLREVFRGDTIITSFDELQYFIGLISINRYSFYGCSGLTLIEIPNFVTSIGGLAFYGCSGLTSIEIPGSVTSIYRNAFIGCNGLEQIVVDSENTVFDSRENCNAIINSTTNDLVIGCKNTVIPSSVTTIGNYAFDYCTGLTSIEIPNSVTSIGNYAFSGCSGLSSIEIPNSVISIGVFAFSGCSSLTSIEIPNSVTSLDYSVFSYCTGLTSVEIPNSVTSIGNYAFSGCSGLTSMTVLTQMPPTIQARTFDNCPKSIPVYVPCGSVEAYQSAAYWNEFTNIQEDCHEIVHFVTAGNWSEATNWQDGTLPGTHAEVYIDANCLLDLNAEVADLNISDGQSLALQSGQTLTVTNALTNAVTTGLVIEDGAQLVHASENVSAMVKKNIVGHGMNNGRYYLISNPLTTVVDPEMSSVYHLITGDYDLYDWLPNASDHLEWRNYKTNDFMMLPEGYGYLYANRNGVELNFPGILKPSNNRYAKSVSYDSNDTDHPGWNLIGNPFVCNAYLVDEEGTPLPYYRMNATGNGFEAVAPGTPIAPMEGVFYVATESETVYFTRIAPSESADKAAKQAKRTVKQINDNMEHSTLGDLEVLAGLKENLEKQEKARQGE